jgi:hypothetical protein
MDGKVINLQEYKIKKEIQKHGYVSILKQMYKELYGGLNNGKV